MADSTIHIDVENSIFEEIRRMKADFSSIKGTVQDLEKKTNESLGGIGRQLKALNLVSIHQGFQNVAQELTNLSKPGLDFEQSLADVSAITGVVGKDLDSLGSKARASALEFGGTASESLESYKTILSRLGPGIAQNEKALALMERSGRILSKTMNNDMTGATDALTTAVLQYGVDLSNPAKAQAELNRMMNVMAAGAKEGAAEVPQLSEALKETGIKAKDAKLSFEETNSALQSLAAGGKFGSQAGIGLRNVLGKLAGEDVIPKEAADKLRKLGVDMRIVSDTSIPFTDRLRELKKASGDATIMAQVFGVENETTAKILINSIDAQESLTKAITGTSVAEQQASTIMDTEAEKAKRRSAWLDDLKISFFEVAGGATQLLTPMAQIGQTITGLAPIASGARSVFGMLKTQFDNSKTSATGLADGIDNIGKTAGKTKGLMSGLGSTLKGIGWGAIAAGIGMVAMRIYDIASGTNLVNRNLDELAKGKSSGEKSAQRKINPIQSNTDAKIKAINDQVLEGTLSEKEAIQKEIKIREAALFKYKDESSASRYERIEREKALKKQELLAKNVNNSVFGLEQKGREFLGLENESTKTAVKRGNLAEKDQELILLREKMKIEEEEIKTLKAKQKGASKTKNTSSNPLSPAGYTTSEKDKLYQGTGGEMKNINIRIDKLVENISVSTTNVTESMSQIKQLVTDALVGAVRNAEIAL